MRLKWQTGAGALTDESTDFADDPTADDQRAVKRQGVLKGAKIVFEDSVVDCVVLNLSDAGARVRTNAVVPIPDQVTLQFSGGAVYSATRRWSRGLESGFSFEGVATLPADMTQVAWRVYETVRGITLAEPIRLLQSYRFFDDIALQELADEAEVGLRRLETALAVRARKPR
jgi:hypothetical protein